MSTISTGAAVGNLDPFFTSLIRDIIQVEQQPLARLTQQRDTIDVRRAAYSDLSSRLNALQTATWAIQDTYGTSMYLGRQATVSDVASGYTVLSASAGSDAIAGTYSLQISKLAQSQSVYSSQQASAGVDLTFPSTFSSGSVGTFTLGDTTFTVTQGTGITYTSGSTTGSVAGTSLNSIAEAINSATYTSGSGVTASVVDRNLVLTSQISGSAGAIVAADGGGTTGILHDLGILTSGGTGFKNVGVAAQNAEFTINGISVSRSENTGLSDVISGVSLNLASDAAGKSAKLTISANTSSARGAVDTFISNFNTMTTYLADRTGTSSSTNNGVTTYTRGSLADDTIFGELRQKMYSTFMNDSSNSGTLKNLREIGLTLDDNLKVTVADSAKLEAALTSNLDNTKLLLDAVADQVDAMLGGFTGKTNGATSPSGYLSTLQKSLESEYTEVNNSITSMTATLTTRQESLMNQFGEMQAQLYLLQYQQQQWQSMYSMSA